MKTPVSILNYHSHSLKWIKSLTERRILLYHKHVFGYTLFFLNSSYKLIYRNSQKTRFRLFILIHFSNLQGTYAKANSLFYFL